MKKYLKTLFNKRYGIYHLRWQISAWVMLGPMIVLQMFGFPLWLNLMIGQFIGAVIFYSIDKHIFKENNAESTIQTEI